MSGPVHFVEDWQPILLGQKRYISNLQPGKHKSWFRQQGIGSPGKPITSHRIADPRTSRVDSITTKMKN